VDDLTNISKDVLANMSIEELEARLEMQIIAIPDADWCLIEGNTCTSLCGMQLME